MEPFYLAIFNTTQEIKEKKANYCDCFYLKVKSQKGGLPARQLGMFFLSPEDESQSPGTGHCWSTALFIPNLNFILKTIFWHIYSGLIKSGVNYHPKPCASERIRSPCRFASLFNFSAKQCVSDDHLHKGKPCGSTWPRSFVIFTLTFTILILLTTSPVPELSFLPAPYRGWTRAGERRVQDNLHAQLRTPPFFPPQIGGKTIFGSTFQIWLVARFSEW